MNLTSRMLGGAMSFAHLAGLAPKAKKAKSRADDDRPEDEEDKPAAADDDDDEKPAGKGKKARAADDDDEKPAAEDDEDEDEKPAAEEDDDEKPAAEDDEDEDEKPVGKGKKAKATSAEYRRGRAAERRRCAEIFASPAAGLNPAAAAELAFNTSSSSAAAIRLLKTMSPATSGSRRDRNPDLGTGPDADPGAAAGKSWGRAFAQVVPAAAGGGGGMTGALKRAAGG